LHNYTTNIRFSLISADLFSPIGKVGITLDCDWKEPNQHHSTLDHYAAERALQFKLGWFANPLFGNGDYPSVMKRMVNIKSIDQGFAKSRLPVFTPEEIANNSGSLFVCLFLLLYIT